MRRLYFTDVHTYPFNEFSKPTSDGRTTLIEEHEKSYSWVAEQIELHKPDLVVNLGDTALTHGYLDAMSMTTIVKGYRQIESTCLVTGSRLVWMTGNHDFENDSTRLHVLPFIDENVLINVAHLEDGHLFVPFYRDKEKWQEAVRAAVLKNSSDVKRVYVHLDVVGARMNAGGIVCKDGYSSEFMGGDIKTFAGHFHHPQVVGNVYVIGSLMYRNFSDEIADRPRGIVIDDDNEGLPMWVENPHTSQYMSLRVEKEGDLANLFKCIHPDRTFLRVTYNPEFEDKVAKLKNVYRGVRLVPMISEKRTSVAVQLPPALDPHGVVDEYLRQTPPADSIKDEVVKLGHDLVEQVVGNIQKVTRQFVQFTSMHIENFLSMQSADLRFDTSEVIYVDGLIEGRDADVSNGAGKSTIFEALFWCLFGSLIREGSVDKVVNSKAGKNCFVSLFCIVGDDEYQIVRARKCAQYGGNDLRIYKGGDLIAQGTKQAEQILRAILGVDETVFRHTTLLVDSLSTRFSLLNGRQRMELLETTVQASLYDTMYDKVHELLKRQRAHYDGVLVSLDRDRRVLSELTQQRDLLKDSVDKQISDLRESIRTKQSRVQENNASIDRLSSMAADRKLKVLSGLQSQAAEIHRERQTLDTEIKQAEQALNQIRRSQALKEKDLADKKKLLEGICPMCKRPVADDKLHTEVADAVKLLQGQLDADLSLATQWASHLEERRKTLVGAGERLAQVDADLRVVQGKVVQMEQEAERHRTENRVASIEIQQLTDQVKSLEGQVAAIEKRMSEVSEGLVSLEETSKSHLRSVQIYEYWDSGFSPKGGCRVWLLNDAIQQLNASAVDFSSMLSDGYVVPSLSVSNNAVQLDVQSQGGDYNSSSSGERRMVDLAAQMGLARLSARYSGFDCNLKILDEVDDKLDAASRRRLIGLLERIAGNENKVVFIASHHRDIKSYTMKTLTVVKRDGISSIR